jgi:sortase A
MAAMMSSRDQAAAASSRTGGFARVAIGVFVALVLATTVGFAVTRTEPATTASAPVALAAAIGDEARGLTPVPQSVLPVTSGNTGTTRAPITTTTEDTRPLPYPLPANPYEATPQVVLGQIEIPKLGVTGDVQEGITLTAINRGPGHWPGTPKPGEPGNMVVAGHRTTYTKPFNRLNELVAGDKVIFHMPNGTFTYEVRGVIIVPAANIGIAGPSDAHVATLFACHPLHSAAQRIVAKLRLLNPDGTPADPETTLPPVDYGSDPVTGTTLFTRNPPSGAPPATGTDPLAGAEG